MPNIKVKGMRCNHCVASVTKALEGIDGLKDVKVDLEKAEASYTEEKPVDRAKIKEAIEKTGFEAE